MNFQDFARKTDVCCKKEVDRVKLVVFFLEMSNGNKEFDLNEVLEKLEEIGVGVTNSSRLKQNLTKCRDFKKNNKTGNWVLNPNVINSMKQEYKAKLEDKNSIESNSELLEEIKFSGKRGFLDKLISQANNCYKNYCYDACAVMLRRIFEITLILAYRHNNIEDEIKDKNGHTLMLSEIVTNAVMNKTLKLSTRNLAKEYNIIRDIGNYAAHKIEYNTSPKDIDDIKNVFRVRLEELYYKAGLLK